MTAFPDTSFLFALYRAQANLASGALEMATVDWADVHRIAERLSTTYTKANGHRALDIFHVATAIHLKAEQLLSFDGNQRKLAAAEGLKVKP